MAEYPPHWQVPTSVVAKLHPPSHDYAIVVPVMNEGERIKRILSSLRGINLCDVILVDGGSTDGSTEEAQLKELGVTTKLTVRERGLGTALRAGLAYALQQNYKGLLTVDGNGKDDVSSLQSFIDCLDDGYDFVQGSRFMGGGSHQNTPLFRLLSLKCVMIPLVCAASGFKFTDPSNGYKGLSRKFLESDVVQPFRDELSGFSFQIYLNIMAGKFFKTIEVPVSRNYPKNQPVPTQIHGFRSHYKLLREIVMAANGRYAPNSNVHVSPSVDFHKKATKKAS